MPQGVGGHGFFAPPAKPAEGASWRFVGGRWQSVVPLLTDFGSALTPGRVPYIASDVSLATSSKFKLDPANDLLQVPNAITNTVQNAYVSICGGTTSILDARLVAWGSAHASTPNWIALDGLKVVIRSTDTATTYATIDSTGLTLASAKNLAMSGASTLTTGTGTTTINGATTHVGDLTMTGAIVTSGTNGIHSAASASSVLIGGDTTATTGAGLTLEGISGGNRIVLRNGTTELWTISSAGSFAPSTDGNKAIGSSSLRLGSIFTGSDIYASRSSTAHSFINCKQVGGSFNLFECTINGTLNWGNGSLATDTNLYRLSGVLKTDNDFTIGSTTASSSTTNGALTVSGGAGIAGALYAGSLNTAGAFAQTGTGTFSTATGAISINGPTTVSQTAAAPSMIALRTTATTASVVSVAEVNVQSSGTPAAGFGSSLVFRVASSTTASRGVLEVQSSWVVATDASRTGRTSFYINDFGAAREILRFEGSGTAGMVGFFGSAAVVRPATYGTPTGGAITANFPGATATLAQTSGTLAQLLLDLKSLGLIGA